jgi:hypothetical protein
MRCREQKANMDMMDISDCIHSHYPLSGLSTVTCPIQKKSLLICIYFCVLSNQCVIATLENVSCKIFFFS